jgi:ABC-2 type transport system permease protein
MGGIVIPAGFDEDVKAGKMPELNVYFNSERGGQRQSAFYQLVESGLRSIAGQTTPANIIFTETANTARGESTAASSSFNLTSFYLLLFLIMSVTMVGVFIVPYILVEEKEKSTLKAILVSPATYTDVVLGKGIVGLFYALLVAAILMAMNNGFTGNVLVTSLAVILGSVFLVLVGLLMGAAFKQLTQVNSWSSIVMVALMLPGMFGDFMPPPAPVATAMKFLPTHYMTAAITQGMNNTATLTGTMVNLGVLAAMSVIAFAAVIWFLKRERL